MAEYRLSPETTQQEAAVDELFRQMEEADLMMDPDMEVDFGFFIIPELEQVEE
jgi:hypothetical protein